MGDGVGRPGQEPGDQRAVAASAGGGRCRVGEPHVPPDDHRHHEIAAAGRQQPSPPMAERWTGVSGPARPVAVSVSVAVMGRSVQPSPAVAGPRNTQSDTAWRRRGRRPWVRWCTDRTGFPSSPPGAAPGWCSPMSTPRRRVSKCGALPSAAVIDRQRRPGCAPGHRGGAPVIGDHHHGHPPDGQRLSDRHQIGLRRPGRQAHGNEAPNSTLKPASAFPARLAIPSGPPPPAWA